MLIYLLALVNLIIQFTCGTRLSVQFAVALQEVSIENSNVLFSDAFAALQVCTTIWTQF